MYVLFFLPSYMHVVLYTHDTKTAITKALRKHTEGSICQRHLQPILETWHSYLCVMFGSRPRTRGIYTAVQSLCCTKKPNRSSFRTVVLALPLLASLLTMSSVKSSDVAQHYFDAQHYSVSERIRGVLDHHIQSTVSCKGVPDGQHADSIIVGPYSRFHIRTV